MSTMMDTSSKKGGDQMRANLLRSEIVANNMTVTSLAESVDMKPKTMYNKMNGTSQFTIDEVIKICEVLKITDAAKKCLIFLS